MDWAMTGEEQIVVQNVRESSPLFFFQRDTDAMIAVGQDGEARQSLQDHRLL
jgi:hypothetical protein